MNPREWDIFISHASEDKDAIVKPLAQTLSELGVDVWYDEFSLEVGDSLSGSIDKGLANSRFGLVILSPAFFEKDWPDYELRGLVAKEIGRDKVILPIWHNITRDEILKHNPALADKLALKSSDHSPEDIAIRLLGIVRPELLEDIHARMAYENLIANGEKQSIPANRLSVGPIRHNELPENLIRRIRLVRAALLTAYPQSMDFWLDGFKRDLHPENEVQFWEHVAACFLEYISINRIDFEQRKNVFCFIFDVLNNPKDFDMEKYKGLLALDTLPLLRDSCLSAGPAYEFRGLPKTLEESLKLSNEELETLKKIFKL